MDTATDLNDHFKTHCQRDPLFFTNYSKNFELNFINEF